MCKSLSLVVQFLWKTSWKSHIYMKLTKLQNVTVVSFFIFLFILRKNVHKLANARLKPVDPYILAPGARSFHGYLDMISTCLKFLPWCDSLSSEFFGFHILLRYFTILLPYEVTFLASKILKSPGYLNF